MSDLPVSRWLVIAGVTAAAFGAAGPAATQPPATLDECEALVRRDPSDLRCFGIIAGRTRQWDDAVRRLERILNENPTLARGWWSLAYIESFRGKERCIELYRKAADGLEAAGSTAEASLALCDMSTALMKRGRLEETDQVLARAEDLARRSGSQPVLAKVRTDQAWRAFNRSELDAAEAILREVEPVVFSRSPLNVQDRWLSAMGSVLWATGRHPEALEAYRKEADLLERLGDRYAAAGVQHNIGVIESLLGLPAERVLKQVRRSLDAAVSSGNRTVEAQVRTSLGSYATEASEAHDQLQRALQISREIGDLRGELIALRFLGERYLTGTRRDPVRGRALLDEARERARRSGDQFSLARSLVLDAHVAWFEARESGGADLRQRAVDASLAGLQAVEGLRGSQEEGLIRARVQGEWAFVYQRLAVLLLDTAPPPQPVLADLELATQVMERLRGRTLLEELAVHRREMTPPGDPVGAPAITLEAVASALAPDEAVLSFITSDIRNPSFEWARDLTECWLLVHTPGATRAYPLPDRADLETAVRLFVGSFRTREAPEASLGAAVHRDLLAPAIADLPPGVRELVIVPDGVLHRLPFEALRATPDAEPLGSRYEISMAPSLTALLRWRRQPRSDTSRSVLALADPRVGSEAGPPGGDTQAAALRSWAAEMNGRLGRLPHARAEVAAIARYMGGGSRILNDDEASERAFKEAPLERYAMLHLAAHGLVDEQRPERSGVLLAAGPGGDDGLLQSREIAQLHLSGQVVVLSSCRSASGALLRGEGFMGLARAFMVAGAPTVVASLWPLRDDEAAALFTDFYRHIGGGASVAAAMTGARRDRIRAGAPAAAWAGVVVMGHGAAVPVPGGRRPALEAWHLGVAGLLVLAGIALARARRATTLA